MIKGNKDENFKAIAKNYSWPQNVHALKPLSLKPSIFLCFISKHIEQLKILCNFRRQIFQVKKSR